MLEFKIKKDELLKGMTQTQSIAEKRSSMPILSNVLLEVQDGRLAITATDLEISFRGTYEADIKNEGRLTVPARKFFEIVRVLGDDEPSIEETENYSLAVTGKRSNYNLHGLSPEDFPPMPEVDEVGYIEMDSEVLLDMVEKTIFSIAMEETRYNLAGVYWEKVEIEPGDWVLRAVSTDGHRLSLIEKRIEDLDKLVLEKGVIISRKGMTEMRKMAETGGKLLFGFTSNSAVIKSENKVLVMRLLEGRFPDYNLVIPKENDQMMSVGRKEFLEMLRRVAVMSSDDFKGVKFSLSPKELVLSAVNPDLGDATESLNVEYEGDEIVMGYNPRYFIDALSAVTSDLIVLALRNKDFPCKLTAADDPGFTGVIMPMKI